MRNILLASLLAGLVSLAACGPTHPTSVHVDPALLTLVPRDTLMLAGMKLDAARKTPSYEKLNAALHLDATP